MADQTQTIQPRIERIEKVWTLDAKIHIPQEDKETVFAYPSFGPNTYLEVGKQILEKGLTVPTGGQTASLLYEVYCSDLQDGHEFEDIRNTMRTRWIQVFNRNLWTSEGVYILQDPEAKGRTEELDVNDLEERLIGGTKFSKGVKFSQDKTLRFAPKDSYKLEYNSSDELASNGFVIASYGVEGAEKLAEVSRKFPNKPYVYGLYIGENQDSELRVSALYGGYGGYGGDKFYVGGSDFDDDSGGHAFGVLK